MMSDQETSKDLHNATFSQALADGHTHCDWLDGRTIGISGQAAHLANRSHLPAKEAEQMTLDIFGRPSGGSSNDADPNWYSASKSHPQKLSDLSLRLLSLKRFNAATMQERTNSLNASLVARLSTTLLAGSMEYNQTWKFLATPSGIQYSAHTASARRTSDNVCGGWPTANATDGSKAPEKYARGNPSLPGASKLTGPAPLGGRVETESGDESLDGWQTPKGTGGGNVCRGNERSGELLLAGQAKAAGWCTPMERDHSRGNQPPRPHDTGIPLSQQAVMAGYPTPSDRDGRRPGSEMKSTQGAALKRDVVLWFDMPDMTGWKLNPRFSLWLQGYPAEWAYCGAPAMRSSRK